jgi:hypothetical protein
MRGNSARLGGIAMRRICSVALAATMLAGCVTTDRVSFRPTAPTQMALFRDGRAAMASTGSATRVVISPRPRQQQRAQRPVFVVAIQNGGAHPVNFTLAGVTAELSAAGTSRPLQVISYEQLVQEARAEAVAGLIIGVALIGAGAAVAGSSGSYSNAVLAGSLAGAGVGTMVGSAERSEEASGSAGRCTYKRRATCRPIRSRTTALRSGLGPTRTFSMSCRHQGGNESRPCLCRAADRYGPGGGRGSVERATSSAKRVSVASPRASGRLCSSLVEQSRL